MVRAILAPKNPEAQFIKRVKEGNDQGLVQAVLASGLNKSVVNVCLCEDGRTNTASCWESVQKGLTQLYALWQMDVVVEIYRFSFMHYDQEAMAAFLHIADVFYFAGIHTVPPMLRTAMASGTLVTMLREMIHYNRTAYFGVCGGAMMAGATNQFDLPGLDLFNGITVKYDSSCSAGSAVVETSYEAALLQMTTGCSLVLLMTPEHIAGRSFTAIKNQHQWREFARDNTAAVLRLVQMKCAEWTRYSWNDDVWYFNLRGYIWLGNCMYLRDKTTGWLSRCM